MKKFSTWLIVMFAVMFLALRIYVAYCASLYKDFFITPLNLTVEIVLLFLALVCIVLIVKRSLIGAIIYIAAYGLYFGGDIAMNIMGVAQSGGTSAETMSVFASLIGIIVAAAALFDILLDKNRKANPKDKNNDWFYKNKDFDRQFDERTDRNEYKF